MPLDHTESAVAVQNTLGHLDWWEVEALISDALVDSPYGAIYFVSGIATFEQVRSLLRHTLNVHPGLSHAWV
jgi:hypothetical protein